MPVVEEFDEWERKYNEMMAAAVAALSPRWGVKGYKAHQTSDGVAFVFTLTDGDKPVAWVEDAGQGGGPWAQWQDRESMSALAFGEESVRLFPGEFSPSELLIEAILQKAGK